MPFLTFYITCPDEPCARRISTELLARRLAACTNVFPVNSTFWWEAAIQHENEWALLAKTTLGMEGRVENAVRELHPYQVPCILRFEARANADFEKWIAESTASQEL